MLAMVGAGIGGGLFLVTIVLIGELGLELIVLIGELGHEIIVLISELGHESISELFYYRCNMHGMRG